MENQKAAKLISENLKNIYGYAFARLYDKDAVDDLTQEIVCEVLKSAGNVKSEEAFWAFLWRVAENTFRKFIKQKERWNSLLPLPDEDASFQAEPSPEDEIVDRESDGESLNLLRRELSLLSKTNREVCLAFYFQNKSCKEIATEQGISLEMVKYHLFKTRQLLKEGIGMERQFGEKSYKPARFEFVTIFSGQFNREYRNLFNRKLPGNILHSAYYTPMTIRELSVELGVSTVYMEDEVALLETYKLLTALPGGRYQTNLVIFTNDFMQNFYAAARTACVKQIGEILCDTKRLLPAVRKLGFCGSALDDNRLLWPLLWLLMLRGCGVFEADRPRLVPDELSAETTGIHYGEDHDESGSGTEEEKRSVKEYGCGAFAGYDELSERYAAAYANFGVLPENCQYHCSDASVKASLLDGSGDYPVFTAKELAQLETVLRDPISKTAELYGSLNEIAAQIMKQHAPKSVEPMVEKIIGKTVLFKTIGFVGKCAVDSGELTIPNAEKPVCVFVFEISDKQRNAVQGS